MPQNFLAIKVNGKHTKSLIDTGASVCCVAQSFLRSLGPSIQIQPSLAKKAIGVGGESHSILGTVQLLVTIDNIDFPQTFYVLPKVHHHVILGDDFLVANSATIDRGDKTISFPICSLSLIISYLIWSKPLSQINAFSMIWLTLFCSAHPHLMMHGILSCLTSSHICSFCSVHLSMFGTNLLISPLHYVIASRNHLSSFTPY